MAKANAKATAKTLPKSGEIPAGFQKTETERPAAWEPQVGEVLQGPTSGKVKTIKMQQGGKTVERRCVQITDQENDERFTVWESAELEAFFDSLEQASIGTEVYLRFDGLGEVKRMGHNAPKLYTSAVATAF